MPVDAGSGGRYTDAKKVPHFKARAMSYKEWLLKAKPSAEAEGGPKGPWDPQAHSTHLQGG